MSKEPIDVVLPVHNEEASIGEVLREFHAVVSGTHGQPIRFVVCEDGSRDNSVAVIRELAKTIPIHLITSSERKGYSKAVVDGLRATTSPLVCFIDSDGQCDPNDFPRLLAEIDSCELVVGQRTPRNDTRQRILMSSLFGMAYRLILGPTTKDPSCPYLIIRRDALHRLLEGQVGIFKQGFWWEFIARSLKLGLKLREIPVNHRQRLAGETRVYLWNKIPKIAYQHFLGLFELRKELRALERK